MLEHTASVSLPRGTSASKYFKGFIEVHIVGSMCPTMRSHKTCCATVCWQQKGWEAVWRWNLLPVKPQSCFSSFILCKTRRVCKNAWPGAPYSRQICFLLEWCVKLLYLTGCRYHWLGEMLMSYWALWASLCSTPAGGNGFLETLATWRRCYCGDKQQIPNRKVKV